MTDQRKKALIGFKCDEGVRRNKGRVGAFMGPDAIRKYLQLEPKSYSDIGDVCCGEQDFTQGHRLLQKMVFTQLNTGVKPVVIGGGHDMSYSNFVGAARFLMQSNKRVKIVSINIDPHLDLRDFSLKANSGTSFTEIHTFCKSNGIDFNYCCLGLNMESNAPALIERARKFNVQYVLDTDQSKVLETVDACISENDYIYLSLDMDVFKADIAPGVSAVAKRGWTKEFVEKLILRILKSNKVIVADIAELNPKYDVKDKTAVLAAYFTELFLKN